MRRPLIVLLVVLSTLAVAGTQDCTPEQPKPDIIRPYVRWERFDAGGYILKHPSGVGYFTLPEGTFILIPVPARVGEADSAKHIS